MTKSISNKERIALINDMRDEGVAAKVARDVVEMVTPPILQLYVKQKGETSLAFLAPIVDDIVELQLRLNRCLCYSNQWWRIDYLAYVLGISVRQMRFALHEYVYEDELPMSTRRWVVRGHSNVDYAGPSLAVCTSLEEPDNPPGEEGSWADDYLI